jgi:hypothetical protein
MYSIKAYYKTGDSFHTYDTTTTEGEWSRLDIAKENLQRIKTHYSYYRYKNNYGRFHADQWEGKPVPSYIVEEDYLDLLMLKADNEEEYRIYPAWCGHFEKLYGAEIITISDETMKFEL